jgi:hypothetical protein
MEVTRHSFSLIKWIKFTILNLHYAQELAFDIENVWLNGFKKIFRYFPYIIIVYKTVSPIVAPPYPWVREFNKLDSGLCQEASM